MGAPEGKPAARGTAEWALRERVKELTCLYGIATVDKREGFDVSAKMQAIADLLPPAWQFPDFCSARIVVDDEVFLSSRFEESSHRLSAEVAIDGAARGRVDVSYKEPPSSQGDGLFLVEERSLIQEVARQVGLILERHEAERQRAHLEEQLRRADRLAMIGELAAGVAHELNEPLVAVLGYAELMQQSFGLPDRTAKDLEKIIKASLHAREVVRKLLTFARQAPAEKAPVDLNQAVRDAMLMLEARLRSGKVKAIFKAAESLPPVLADPGQLQQVILNLCVNAMQAMPEGGGMEVRTGRLDGGVMLRVSDTGDGMSEEVQQRLFTPFFTTKQVGQGTGLGLSVVHGIVAAHGGTIQVQSSLGKGSAFEVVLPAAVSVDGR